MRRKVKVSEFGHRSDDGGDDCDSGDENDDHDDDATLEIR